MKWGARILNRGAGYRCPLPLATTLTSEPQDRLCYLALMIRDRDETEKADFDEIIDEFASIKARKVLF